MRVRLSKGIYTFAGRWQRPELGGAPRDGDPSAGLRLRHRGLRGPRQPALHQRRPGHRDLRRAQGRTRGGQAPRERPHHLGERRVARGRRLRGGGARPARLRLDGAARGEAARRPGPERLLPRPEPAAGPRQPRQPRQPGPAAGAGRPGPEPPAQPHAARQEGGLRHSAGMPAVRARGDPRGHGRPARGPRHAHRRRPGGQHEPEGGAQAHGPEQGAALAGGEPRAGPRGGPAGRGAPAGAGQGPAGRAGRLRRGLLGRPEPGGALQQPEPLRAAADAAARLAGGQEQPGAAGPLARTPHGGLAQPARPAGHSDPGPPGAAPAPAA